MLDYSQSNGPSELQSGAMCKFTFSFINILARNIGFQLSEWKVLDVARHSLTQATLGFYMIGGYLLLVWFQLLCEGHTRN